MGDDVGWAAWPLDVGTTGSRRSCLVLRTLRPVQPLFRAAAGALVLLMVWPAAALAHARLIESSPAAGATLTVVPAQFTLTFNEPLTGASSVAIVDASGATIASGSVPAGNPATITGSFGDLPNGTYEVRWTAVTDDANVERGTFQFSVAVPSLEPSVAPTAAASGTGPATPPATAGSAPATTPTPTAPAVGGSGDGGGADVVLPITLFVLVLGIGLVALLRRRGSPA